MEKSFYTALLVEQRQGGAQEIEELGPILCEPGQVSEVQSLCAPHLDSEVQ